MNFLRYLVSLLDFPGDDPGWDSHRGLLSQGLRGLGVALKGSRESGWLVTAGLTSKRGMRKQGDEDRK